MLKSGRISISGCEYSIPCFGQDTADYLVNEGNVRYVAMGIDDVVRTVT